MGSFLIEIDESKTVADVMQASGLGDSSRTALFQTAAQLIALDFIATAADAAAADASHDIRVLPGLKMLVHVDLETPRAPSALFQTAAQLIALDLRTREPVLVLLTNLTDVWQFLWVGNDASTSIQVATLARADEAFEVLRAALAADASDASDLRLPCLVDERVQRLKLTALAARVGSYRPSTVR